MQPASTAALCWADSCISFCEPDAAALLQAQSALHRHKAPAGGWLARPVVRRIRMPARTIPLPICTATARHLNAEYSAHTLQIIYLYHAVAMRVMPAITPSFPTIHLHTVFAMIIPDRSGLAFLNSSSIPSSGAVFQ